MRMLQTLAPAIFSVTVFILIRFRPSRLKVDFRCCIVVTFVHFVNFTRVNKKEAIYERPLETLKLRKVQLLRLRATVHTLPLFLFYVLKIYSRLPIT